LRKTIIGAGLIALGLGLSAATPSLADPPTLPLLAVGVLDSSRAGNFADLSGLTYNLENNVRANELGGLGSGLAYANGNTFLALPDRGPNAVPFDSNIDDTVSYINRFQTVTMNLTPNNTPGLPFILTPKLQATTLLWSLTPLSYGEGGDGIVGSGKPPLNNFFFHFLTGRSDGFGPGNSGNPKDARFDTEGIRLSNDGLRVYISDEYGPYVYEFDRILGVRLRSFTLPSSFYVQNLSAMGANEMSPFNTSGRVANKGMEGLAITPDGRTLVGIMQNSLIQDAALGGSAAKMLRIVTIDLPSGHVTHQYAYLLSDGSGVSEICALNNHEFLVDERDGKGRGDGSKAKFKELWKIDLNTATDVSAMNGTDAAANAVGKTLFVDLVASLKPFFATDQIPAKIEGVAFGPDVKTGNSTLHTLWIANDNDFLEMVADDSEPPVMVANPNQFFVFGFTASDLGGSQFVPQQFHGLF